MKEEGRLNLKKVVYKSMYVRELGFKLRDEQQSEQLKSVSYGKWSKKL